MSITRTPAKQRLLDAGIMLFAEKEFKSVSVREICSRAQTSINMIHHYYGSKKGLFQEITNTFTEKVFRYPLAIIEEAPTTHPEFLTKIDLFFKATLEALMDQYLPLRVVMKHDINNPSLTKLVGGFIDFLQNSQNLGFVRRELDVPMISGSLMDRLVNQVLYADKIKKYTGDDLFNDRDYRNRWRRANCDLYLFGMAAQQNPSTTKQWE